LNKLRVTLLILGTLTAAACQSPQQKIGQQEDMLVAAGFKFVPVNTPARQASFKQLPPNKFARETRDGRTFYVYPDPMVCGCLYVGDQRAYGTYNFNLLQKNMADQQQAAADALMATWDWGPWGGYPDGWYY
jgi:hypothetical protein